MDAQSKQGGPPAVQPGAAADHEAGRAIADVQGIDADNCAAGKAQSEYVPDGNNSMEKALGHGPKK